MLENVEDPEEEDIEFKSSPLSQDSNTNNFNFGLEMDFDLKLLFDPKFKFKIIKLVFDKKYYFSPKYYNYDAKKRIIYTPDSLINIQLNLNLLNLDQRFIFLILSILQLNSLGLINSSKSNDAITLICDYCNLKFRYKYHKRFAILQRLVNGKEVERITLVLTDEQFLKEFESGLSRFKVSFDTKGFKTSKNIDSS